ncbi:DUF4194 domain-containing protein [Paenibacillus hamazuiensis]|uniref:DUF4194 domain-containing protein n=1 Tax=Paenibacillus hamazuiensis TaxID=2936508 RepID=UPI0020104677|nr:DUF4194 domain-containing protein [Paenibacillus hamazuiensis]
MMFHDVSDSEQGKIRDVINRLLEVNLLVKEKDREAYMVIRRHRPALEAYFRFLGWELSVDERHECVYLHIPDGRLRKRLDREQTVWLLVLRLIYEEKRQGLSLADFPMTTLYEIRSKYETFRLDWVNRTTLDKLIRFCSQFQLLEPLDEDTRSDDARFKLFHTWMYLIQADGLKQLAERLERYETGGEGDLFDEVDEAASLD